MADKVWGKYGKVAGVDIYKHATPAIYVVDKEQLKRVRDGLNKMDIDKLELQKEVANGNGKDN